MDLAAAIRGDFVAIVDNPEFIRLWSRASGLPAGVVNFAKRFAEKDKRQAEESLGFAVSDFVMWDMPRDNLTALGFYPLLGDWLTDGQDRRYAIVSIFESAMTGVVKCRTVSLEEVLGSTVSIFVRGPQTSTGAPGDTVVPYRTGIRASIWAYDQAGSDPMGDDLRPRFRCAFWTDGRQVPLPLPQPCTVMDERTGLRYDVAGVRQLDKLAGFAFLDMTLADAKKAGA